MAAEGRFQTYHFGEQGSRGRGTCAGASVAHGRNRSHAGQRAGHRGEPGYQLAGRGAG